MWRLPSALPSFVLYFYPPKCSCFPVCLQSKLLGDREDGGTLTGKFSPFTETLGQEPDESLSTNVLGSDHDCKCVEMMSFFISSASGPKGVFHLWCQYYDAA